MTHEERAKAIALELWTNSRSIYAAEVGNTRQREATEAALEYLASSILSALSAVAQEARAEEREACANTLQRAIDATHEHGLIPLTPQECVTMLRARCSEPGGTR